MKRFKHYCLAAFAGFLCLRGSANVLVNNPFADQTGYDTQSETSLIKYTKNGQEIIVVAYIDSGSKTVSDSKRTGISRSIDGGLTFQDGGALSNDIFGNWPGDYGDPVLVRDPVRDIIYLAVLTPKQPNHKYIAVYQSTDDGQTFRIRWKTPFNTNPVTNISAVQNPVESTLPSLDKPWMTVDSTGRVYVGFSANYIADGFIIHSSLHIYYANYEDRTNDPNSPGRGVYSFLPLHNSTGLVLGLVDPGPGEEVPGGIQLVVDSSNNLHVVCEYFSFDSGYNYVGLYYNKFTFSSHATATGTWLHTTFSAQNPQLWIIPLTSVLPFGNLGFVTQTLPMMVYSNAENRIDLVYATEVPPQSGSEVELEIYHSYIDLGASTPTWSTPVNISEDGTGSLELKQWNPTVAVTPDGTKLFVGFYERNGQSLDSPIRTMARIGTIQANGTVAFGSKFQVSSSEFPAVYGVDTGVGGGYMGHYDSAAADNSYFYYSWGDNRDSSLSRSGGNSHQSNVRFAKIATSNGDIVSPVQPTIERPEFKLAAGPDTALALSRSGQLYRMGYYFGQSPSSTKAVPVSAPQGVTFVDVAIGGSHIIALGNNGKVYAWGYDDYGQLGDGALGGGLVTEGSMTTVKKHAASGPLPELTDIVKISVGGAEGGYHNLALSKSGAVYVWGANWSKQLGIDPNYYPDLATASSVDRAVQLTINDKVCDIAAGGAYSLLVTISGRVFAWGDNSYGQLGMGSGDFTLRAIPTLVNSIDGVQSVAASYDHSLAVTLSNEQPSVKSWGSNLAGKLGNGQWWGSYPVPAQIASQPGALQYGFAIKASAGSYNSSVWRMNSTGYRAGAAYLGDNTSNYSAIVSAITAVNDWVQIVDGHAYALGIKSDGTVWAWGGNNSWGQLGIGSYDTPLQPDDVQIHGTTNQLDLW